MSYAWGSGVSTYRFEVFAHRLLQWSRAGLTLCRKEAEARLPLRPISKLRFWISEGLSQQGSELRFCNFPESFMIIISSNNSIVIITIIIIVVVIVVILLRTTSTQSVACREPVS